MRDEVAIEEVRDLEARWEELRALFLGLHDYHEPFFHRRLRDDWEDRWRKYVKLGSDRLILMARNGDGPIAYLNAGMRRDFGIFDESVGFIDDVFVQSEFRGQGLGQTLLERAEAWCRTREATQVRLNVAAANELDVSFWTKSGFEPHNITMRKAL